MTVNQIVKIGSGLLERIKTLLRAQDGLGWLARRISHILIGEVQSRQYLKMEILVHDGDTSLRQA